MAQKQGFLGFSRDFIISFFLILCTLMGNHRLSYVIVPNFLKKNFWGKFGPKWAQNGPKMRFLGFSWGCVIKFSDFFSQIGVVIILRCDREQVLKKKVSGHVWAPKWCKNSLIHLREIGNFPKTQNTLFQISFYLRRS